MSSPTIIAESTDFLATDVADVLAMFGAHITKITPSDGTELDETGQKTVDMFLQNVEEKLAAMATAPTVRKVRKKRPSLTAFIAPSFPPSKNAILSVRFPQQPGENDWGLSVVRKHFPRLTRYIRDWGRRNDNKVTICTGIGRTDFMGREGEGRVHPHASLAFEKPVSQDQLEKIKSHLLSMLPAELVNDETIDLGVAKNSFAAKNYVLKNAETAKRTKAIKGVRLRNKPRNRKEKKEVKKGRASGRRHRTHAGVKGGLAPLASSHFRNALVTRYVLNRSAVFIHVKTLQIGHGRRFPLGFWPRCRGPGPPDGSTTPFNCSLTILGVENRGLAGRCLEVLPLLLRLPAPFCGYLRLQRDQDNKSAKRSAN